MQSEYRRDRNLDFRPINPNSNLTNTPSIELSVCMYCHYYCYYCYYYYYYYYHRVTVNWG
jgi:hypothetical protein